MRFLLAAMLAKEEDVVGVDIGDDYVAAAQLAITSDGKLELINVGGETYPPGASEKETVAAIKRLWHRHGFRSRTVCSCLRTPSLILRHFEFAHLTDDELEGALRLEAEAALQSFGKAIEADWLLVHSGGPAASGAGHPHSGLLCAAPRSDVDRHLKLLSRAGLYPVVMDTSGLAVCNLFLGLRAGRHEDEAACLASLLNHSADIAILYHDECIYPRTVLCTSSAWKDAAGYFVENLEDALRYYRVKGHRHAVERIVLTGNLPRDAAFYDAVQQGLGLPVERWNPLAEIPGWPAKARKATGLETVSGSLMATCLGLALRRS